MAIDQESEEAIEVIEPVQNKSLKSGGGKRKKFTNDHISSSDEGAGEERPASIKDPFLS